MTQFNRLKDRAPCSRRWRIYASFVSSALQELEAIGGENTFAATALRNHALLVPLVEKLDLLTASAVSKDLAELRDYLLIKRKTRNKPLKKPVIELSEINGARKPVESTAHKPKADKNSERGYRQYFDRIVNVDVRLEDGQTTVHGVENFLGRYRNTHHFLDKVTSNFIRNTRLAVSRITADREKIATTFFGPSSEVLEILKITDSGSDTHKGGKSVLFVDLKVRRLVAPSDVEQRIIYKPSDLELDYLMCGDTRSFNAYAPAGRMDSLAEWVNHYSSTTNSEDSLRLPTYKILPVNPGSVVNRTASSQLSLENSYGYAEFLGRYPDMNAKGLPTVSIEHTLAGTDWLCTEEEAHEFYRVWGGWLAIARVFSWGDMHAENVIASGKKPMPIDLEAGFSGPMKSLVDTQAVGGQDTAYREVSLAPNNKKPKPLKEQRDLAKLELNPGSGGLTGRGIKVFNTPVVNERTVFLSVDQKVGEKATANRVVIREDGHWVRAAVGDHVPVIIKSMKQVLKLFKKHNAELRVWTNTLHRCVARFVPTATGKYLTALASVTGTGFCDSDPKTRPWELKVKYDIGFDSGSMRALLSTEDHDYRDLMNHDIPYYCHQLGQRALFNARGECVHPEYFSQPTFEDVIHQIDCTKKKSWIEEVLKDAALVMTGRSTEGKRGVKAGRNKNTGVKKNRVGLFEKLMKKKVN